jgi:hypothetical protein
LKQKTLSVFIRIEEQRSELISLYESLTPEQLRFNPGPGEWNMLQVMRHLVTAEKQSLLLIMRNIGRLDRISDAGAGAMLRHLILRVALFLPIKFKAPKVADVTEEFPDYTGMKKEWHELREEIRQLIDNGNEELFTKAIYRHPRAGDLNLKQSLEFFEMHIAHHRKQVDRIRNSPEFPASA